MDAARFQEAVAKCRPDEIAEMLKDFGPEKRAWAASLGINIADLERDIKTLTENPSLIQQTQQHLQGLTSEQLADQLPKLSPAAPSTSHSAQKATGNSTMKTSADLESMKNSGNELFKNHKYEAAAERYRETLICLEKSNAIVNRDELELACRLNLAACYGNVGLPAKAVEECTAVLALDYSNRKALYRRGKAYKALRDWDLAEYDLQRCLDLELDPLVETTLAAVRKQKAQTVSPIASGKGAKCKNANEINFSAWTREKLEKYLDSIGVKYSPACEKVELVALAKGSWAGGTISPHSDYENRPSTKAETIPASMNMASLGNMYLNMEPAALREALIAQKKALHDNPEPFVRQVQQQTQTAGWTAASIESQLDMMLEMEPDTLKQWLTTQQRLIASGLATGNGAMSSPEELAKMDPAAMQSCLRLQMEAMKDNQTLLNDFIRKNPYAAGLSSAQLEAQLQAMTQMEPEQFKAIFESKAIINSLRSLNSEGPSGESSQDSAMASPADIPIEKMSSEQLSKLMKLQRDIMRSNPAMASKLMESNPQLKGYKPAEVQQHLDQLANMEPATLHRLLAGSQHVHHGLQRIKNVTGTVDRWLHGMLFPLFIALVAVLTLYVMDMLYARWR